jgi:CheY-like chemotaxis protein
MVSRGVIKRPHVLALSRSHIIQRWLEDHARDILDESDEILSPKYQLIYTVGTQHNPDGESIRWKIVQEVLSILKEEVQRHYYEDVELQGDAGPQQFPQIRVFTQECGMRLFQSIAESIIFDDSLSSLSFRRFSLPARKAILEYITQPTVMDIQRQQDEAICHASLTQDPSIQKTILLLRGLLGHGVLLTALKEKRWRVDYGLDTTRSMLAVPYRAKDSPSSHAEFGHTDMAITLTCLSYYYNGLEEAQLELSFEQLFKTDDPSPIYDEWTKDCPSNLPSLDDLNLDDPVQWRCKIFPTLQYCKATIDFFLATIVFPRQMKEFPNKLSTSGWDLIQDRSSIGQPVTGFSGTNDNCFLLPTMVEQVDLPDHRPTNATVLSFLLQQENRRVVHSDDAQHNVEELLTYLRHSQPTTRVLLDVGAQVVRHSNLEVATLWLKVDQRVEAAVFVDSGDELCVLRRGGSVELLVHLHIWSNSALRGLSRRGSYAWNRLEATARIEGRSDTWSKTLQRQAGARYNSFVNLSNYY